MYSANKDGPLLDCLAIVEFIWKKFSRTIGIEN